MRFDRWLLLLIGVIAVVLSMLASGLLPASKRPELGENRVLATMPRVPRNTREFRQYAKLLDRYVADCFPARPFFIASVNYLRYRLGYSGTPRVVVGDKGWLFYDNGNHLAEARNASPLTLTERTAWLNTFVARTEQLRAKGIVYIVLSAPLKELVCTERAPSWARKGHGDAALLESDLHRVGYSNLVTPRTALIARRKTEPRVYTPFETHWTGLGAHVAYLTLLEKLSQFGYFIEPLPLEYFTPVDTKAQNLSLMLGIGSFVTPHSLSFYNPLLEHNLKVTYLTDKTDWTAPRVVKTGLADKPTLLLTMDSFSNELLHFLYPHFSQLIISHEQDGFYREDLIERYRPNIVMLEVIESGLRVTMGPPMVPNDDLQRKIMQSLQ